MIKVRSQTSTLEKRQKKTADREEMWTLHNRKWRDPAQISSLWEEANSFDRKLFQFKTKDIFWETLAKLKVTLLVTREYEHFCVALNHSGTKPEQSFQPMPHPSGLVVNRKSKHIYIASTRNPNQLYVFKPLDRHSLDKSSDSKKIKSLHSKHKPKPLLPSNLWFFPGNLYIHDLALIKDDLYANAVTQNAIIRFKSDGGYERVWWPNCIESLKGPRFDLNYLQLNSIAAGDSIQQSFFSASTSIISRVRPGHRNFAVDGRGVVFSGQTREPIAEGLTRPHSVRIFRQKVWVDNSGYGEFGYLADGRFHPIVKLPGWTRGLCFIDNIAFVGTSRVIPKFKDYAPGLDPEKSICGIHAIDMKSGNILGQLIWPNANQIFAIDWMPDTMSHGFPFNTSRKRALEQELNLFYTWEEQ